jgi:DNA invertase Pin-like site-specific DNA recombinase
VVSKLDRLGRTQVEVIVRLNDLQQQGVHVQDGAAGGGTAHRPGRGGA